MEKAAAIFVLTFATFCALFAPALSSSGDRSYIFSKCVQKCSNHNCSNEERFQRRQSFHLKALQWSCEDECKYDCMWHTVKAFEDDGSSVPQFYGKWPFIRFAGIQEPASMIFSVLNALTHLAILRFRDNIDSSTPMYGIWHGMALVGVVTWSCAAVFHTRDFPITERLDYFSAFGLVLYNLFTLIARVLVGRDRRLLAVPILLLVSFYVYHVQCLYEHFDYGYNMLVNVAVGAINAFGWVCWCWYQYSSKGRLYVLNGALVVMGLALLLSLELFDFPPLWWTLDAHALWHAGTVPLTLWWYKFVIQDSRQLQDKGDQIFKKMI